MAEDAEQSGSGVSSYLVPIMLVLTALAGAGGVFWQQPFLSSFRPVAHPQRSIGSNISQNIEARLWQDPVGAVDQAQRDAAANGNGQAGSGNFHPLGLQDMQNMLDTDYRQAAASGSTYSLHVLLSMTPGGMYAEDVESRLRAREAVLSALSVAGYCEEQEDMIGCWKFQRPTNSLVNQAPDSRIRLLPFERFVPKHDADFFPTAGNCVLVIWVPDLFFQESPSAPLERLAGLIDEVRKFPAPNRYRVKIDILGPVGSSMLYDMLHEGVKGDGSPDPKEEFTDGRVRMFSWSATAEEKLLMEGATPKETGTDVASIPNFFLKRYGLHFYNTTARDDNLSQELVDELNLRGVDLTDRSQHVALFYEWDTFYGRTLPTSFTNYVAFRQKAKSLQPVPADCDYGYVTSLTPNLHRFTYLRGLDGLTQAEQEDKQAETQDQGSADKSASDQNKSDANGMNRSEGENQLDYIERAALSLQHLRDDLESGRYPGGKGRLAAIGLMGSDFYDKLLILEALRPRFPDVVFFTTDLDGRFVDQDYRRWTRNLVVASNFGLTLSGRYQGQIPAFRWNYQTSLFLAALEALGKAKPRSAAPPPRRFEIGRFHAVDLSTTGDEKGLQPAIERTKPPALPTGFFFYLRWVAAIAACMAILRLLKTFVPPIRNNFKLADGQHQIQAELYFTSQDILKPNAVARKLDELVEQYEHLPGEFASKLGRLGKEWQRCRQEKVDVSRQMLAELLNDSLRKERGIDDCQYESMATQLAGSRLQEVFPSWFWRCADRPRWYTIRLARLRLHWESVLGQRLVGSSEERCRMLNDQLNWAPLGTVLAVIATVVFLMLIWHSHTSLFGEPFSLTEGLSAWPGEICRFAALVLSLIFIGKALYGPRFDEIRITEEFSLGRARPVLGQTAQKPVAASLGSWFDRLCRFCQNIAAIGWYHPPGPVVARKLWKEYRYRGQPRYRFRRSVAHVAVYIFFCMLIGYYLLPRGMFFVPMRGVFERRLDRTLLLLSVVSFLLLNFIVADAARLARSFTRLLIRGNTIWPLPVLETNRIAPYPPAAKAPDANVSNLSLLVADAATLARSLARLLIRGNTTRPGPTPESNCVRPAPDKAKCVRARAANLDDEVEWVDIQFIGRLTSSVYGLVYYPAIVLCLLIVARSEAFDNWGWPPGMTVIFTLNAIWPLMSAFLLQTAASDARKDALGKIEENIRLAKIADDNDRMKSLKLLRKRIKEYREGAFTSYLDNPALKALLVPFTGAGVSHLLPFLTSN
jgi:hypothetical protein